MLIYSKAFNNEFNGYKEAHTPQVENLLRSYQSILFFLKENSFSS